MERFKTSVPDRAFAPFKRTAAVPVAVMPFVVERHDPLMPKREQVTQGAGQRLDFGFILVFVARHGFAVLARAHVYLFLHELMEVDHLYLGGVDAFAVFAGQGQKVHLKEHVVVVDRIRAQPGEKSVPYCDAGDNRNEPVGKPLVGGVFPMVRRLPKRRHRHHDGLAHAGRHFYRHPVYAVVVLGVDIRQPFPNRGGRDLC